MSTITRQLPWIIKDPTILIIGKQCYTSLVENLDVTDVACLKYSLSKVLGFGIVIFGSIMKVPQLYIILRARSAQGISLPSYILETSSYAITLAYSARNKFPFSTYGENLFLTLSNVLVTLLIIRLSSKVSSATTRIATAIIAYLAAAFSLAIVPPTGLSFLQLLTIPLSLLSKFPQMYENYHTRSTGQLSSVAVLSQIVGCFARLFTTATEVGDSIVFAGYLLALGLNLVLGWQMYAYWGREPDDRVLGRPTASKEKSNLENIVVPPLSPWPSQGGRRWTRKVD